MQHFSFNSHIIHEIEFFQLKKIKHYLKHKENQALCSKLNQGFDIIVSNLDHVHAHLYCCVSNLN